MASLPDVNHIAVVNFRADVFIFGRNAGKRKQAVQLRYQIGIQLNCGNIIRQADYQFVEKTCFNGKNFFFGTQNFFFVFFQFLGDVALRIHQCLLANPGFGYFVLVHIAHFDEISEHIVITDFQGRNARSCTFSLLNFKQIAFARMSQSAEFVQIGIHTGTNNFAFIHQNGWIVLNFPVNFLRNNFAGVQLVSYFFQRHIFHLRTGTFNGFNSLQSHFQLHHFAWIYTSYRYFRDNSFQISNQRNLLFQHVF